MADIRPKDLLPTAEGPADDDYLLLDGATQGTRKILANAAVQNAFAALPNSGAEVRYVSLQGDDSNAGTSWANAKRTVAAAVASLPQTGQAAYNLRKTGTINIGAGRFIETELPIPVNASIRFFGQGTSYSSEPNQQTQIYAGDGSNSHVFAPTAEFTDWAHHVLFKNLSIHGNKANNSGNYDLIQLHRPGFNCSLHNVILYDACRYGLTILRSAANFYAYNLGIRECNASGINIELSPTSNLANIAFFGTQIDNCGVYAVRLYSEASGNNVVMFYGLETEALDSGASLHENVIRYIPAAGDNGVALIVDGLCAFRMAGSGPAAIHEENGAGARLRLQLRHANRTGYNAIFTSAKMSNVNLTNVIGAALNDDLEISRSGAGVVLRNANGVRYRIGVNNSGVLTATAL